MNLEKCYVYASKGTAQFPVEYRLNYDKVTKLIEKIECAETVRTVLRMRYAHGIPFVEIAKTLGFSYQWVYELHKIGVSLLEKQMTL